MKFRVYGKWKASGEDVEMVIDASSEEDVLTKASYYGVNVQICDLITKPPRPTDKIFNYLLPALLPAGAISVAYGFFKLKVNLPVSSMIFITSGVILIAASLSLQLLLRIHDTLWRIQNNTENSN